MAFTLFGTIRRTVYRLSQLRTGLEHPSLVLRELNRLYFRRLYTRSFNPDGVRFLDEDWDTILLLDGCRYDAFEATSELPGRLEAAESMASETVGFLRANLDGRDLRDTVYVTANPQLHRHRDSFDIRLHEIVHVWDVDGWDEDYGTVLPETTSNYALRAARQYPNKRLIVHFMQPHYPFLTAETTFDKGHLDDESADTNLWYRKMYGDLGVAGEELWRLYLDSLRQTLPVVERLLEGLSGRTVVTADHGNMFGERSFPIPIREWGHPHSTFTPELVRVPWLVVTDGDRREIIAEESADQQENVTADVDERLRSIGYI